MAVAAPISNKKLDDVRKHVLGVLGDNGLDYGLANRALTDKDTWPDKVESVVGYILRGSPTNGASVYFDRNPMNPGLTDVELGVISFVAVQTKLALGDDMTNEIADRIAAVEYLVGQYRKTSR